MKPKKYMTVNDLARHFGRCPATMRRIVRSRGVAPTMRIAGVRVWSESCLPLLAPGPPGWWRPGR